MRKLYNKKGFTLFELLAVMAILAIIAGIAVPRVMATIKASRIDAIGSSMEMAANAARRYVIEQQIADNVIAEATFTSASHAALDPYLESFPAYITVTIAANAASITVSQSAAHEGVPAGTVSDIVINP